MKTLTNQFLHEENIIPYKPELNSICKTITSNILFNQILYWWEKSNKEEFFKFKAPCNHEKYKEGNSWCEELNISKKQFDTAIKNIAFKRGVTKNKIKKENAIIEYYTVNGITNYIVKEDLLYETLKKVYNEKGTKKFLLNRSKNVASVSEN